MIAAEFLADRYPARRKALLRQWQEEARRDAGDSQFDVFA
jgi:hypothetical protein